MDDIIDKINELVDLKHRIIKFEQNDLTNTKKMFRVKGRYKRIKKELERKLGREFYSYD